MVSSKEHFDLINFNVTTASEQDMRDLITHLQEKMSTTYVYWVGEWADGKRAASTRTHKFVDKEEVINYLNSK